MKIDIKTIGKAIWKFTRNKLWYLFLLLISSIYVHRHFNEIYQLNDLNVQTLIFIVWLILMLFPLFSEFELLGVKIKRAVEVANKEVKADLRDIERQVSELRISTNVANNIQIVPSALPSVEKLAKLLNSPTISTNNNVSDQKDFEDTEDRAVYLFKVRLKIETMLFELLERFGDNRFEISKPRMSLIHAANLLYQNEVLDIMTADMLIQVVRIANRGVHGETISDEYINFVKKAFPEIEAGLKRAARETFGLNTNEDKREPTL